jgi:DNA-binding SARP family transcriptional activator
LSLFSNDEPVDLSGWSRSKAYQMLLRTVLEQGGDLPRDATIRLLWPDLEKCSAANNYYVTLSKLTHNLASRCSSEDMSDIIVRSTSGRVRLNVEICDCDIIQFEAATISARKCVLERDFISAFQHYYRMIEIYRGDLLVGDHDYPWLELHRARFRKQFFDSMVAACTLCLEVGQPDETHFFIDAALRHELGREAFYEMSVRAYKAVGRREDALNAYYEYVEYLQEKLGLDPSPEFQALFNDLLTS